MQITIFYFMVREVEPQQFKQKTIMKNKISSKQQFHNLTILTTVAILISSCSKEDPKQPLPNNPQEVLTTIIINGYNSNEPNNMKYQFAYKWEDLDGDGGATPIIDTLKLDTGITFSCKIIILDKTKTPFDTVSNAIEVEKNVHQFFYSPSTNLSGKTNTEILDFDTNIPSLPVGLRFQINTKSNIGYSLPIQGSLNVILSHYDGVPKTVEKSSESDIDINFPIVLK